MESDETYLPDVYRNFKSLLALEQSTFPRLLLLNEPFNWLFKALVYEIGKHGQFATIEKRALESV